LIQIGALITGAPIFFAVISFDAHASPSPRRRHVFCRFLVFRT
jgi:hypothetical protein